MLNPPDDMEADASQERSGLIPNESNKLFVQFWFVKHDHTDMNQLSVCDVPYLGESLIELDN